MTLRRRCWRTFVSLRHEGRARVLPLLFRFFGGWWWLSEHSAVDSWHYNLLTWDFIASLSDCVKVAQ